MRTLNQIFAISFLIISTFLFTACKDDEQEAGQGQVNIKVTDAAIDDANIKSAHVTIAEVWVDGQKVEGFSKKTIELTAYQNGNSLLLASDTVGAGTYNNISLVLDLESDEWGESPGCFILTESIKKHSLATSAENTVEIDLTKEFTVNSDGSTDLVVDFDLRKAVKYDNFFDAESDYSFVTSAELKTALRTVVESNTGSIKGKLTKSAATGERLFVYAYKKGEFDAETETSAQGSGNIQFSNAVTSSEVDDSDNYKLSFLEEGEYELHIAAYDNDSNGKAVFTGLVEASSVGEVTLLNNVSVESNTELSLNINITGLLSI